MELEDWNDSGFSSSSASSENCFPKESRIDRLPSFDRCFGLRPNDGNSVDSRSLVNYDKARHVPESIPYFDPETVSRDHRGSLAKTCMFDVTASETPRLMDVEDIAEWLETNGRSSYEHHDAVRRPVDSSSRNFQMEKSCRAEAVPQPVDLEDLALYFGPERTGRNARLPVATRNLDSCGYASGEFLAAAPSYVRTLANSRLTTSARHEAPRDCPVGPVDVEDLALYVQPDRPLCPTSSDISCSFRDRQRPPPPAYAESQFWQRQQHPSRTKSHEYRRQEAFYEPTSSCYQCPNYQNCNNKRLVEPFGFCDEDRWLQCPASDRCPLYDPAVPFAPAINYSVLPCMTENLNSRNYDYRAICDYQERGIEDTIEDYLDNERRKERSRDAARCRRSRETDIFTELAAALPITTEQANHLDKASVMRLAIAYLKVRSVVDAKVPSSVSVSPPSDEMDQHFLKALNGFMLVLSSNGNMIYLSQNVSEYLGVSQMDMMGQSVYEYSHPCDHEELRECLEADPEVDEEKRDCNFFLRLKCTLTSKGRKVNLKSATYKVIHCTGHLAKVQNVNLNSIQLDSEEEASTTNTDENKEERKTSFSMILVGCPIPHPSNIEIPLGLDTFLSKHNLNMKFTYADEKLAEYLGWNSEELVGQSAFDFFHAMDNMELDKSFKSLFAKGQCETVAYRFLVKRGGYAWVITQATVINCSKQQRPQSVVCVNYVLSGVECENEVYSVRQLACSQESSQNIVEATPSTSSASTASQSQPNLELRVNLKVDEEILDEKVSEESKKDIVLGEPTVYSDTQELQPLSVTASLFRHIPPESTRPSTKHEQEEEFQRVLNTFASINVPKKEPVADTRKLTEPARREQPKRQFVFQGKPAIDQVDLGRRARPQAVTKSLFAPLFPDQPFCRPLPQTTTASIFAPRTEDMNKGFLTFCEDQPGLTMLKDEPEDLTHLAPTAGDVCVPLEDDTPFFTDMLDEFILGSDENYCPLLSPGNDALGSELRDNDLGDTDLSVSPAGPRTFESSLSDGDPFMYGDSPCSPCSVGPPSLTKYRQSSERSMDSIGSPTRASGGDGLSEDEMLMLGITDSMGDDELALRAPYIPMSDQDETLEMLISDDMVMWGPSQPTDKSLNRVGMDGKEQRNTDSSLAQLLKMDQPVSRRYYDHGGGLVNPVQVLGQTCRKNTPAIEASRWKTDRASKRIHSTSGKTDSKRLKCEPEPTSSSTGRRGNNSQLLRCLVSRQDAPRNESRDDVERRCSNPSYERGRCQLDDDEDSSNCPDNGSTSSAYGSLSGDSLNGDAIASCNRVGGTGSASNSVLMNLLVSGCDVSAGYVCLTKPKAGTPKNSIAGT